MGDILKAASKGAAKTHIMYECYLSFTQLSAYLDYLMDKGLLASHPRQNGNSQSFQTFKLTKKGEAFLKAYSDLKRLLV